MRGQKQILIPPSKFKAYKLTDITRIIKSIIFHGFLRYESLPLNRNPKPITFIKNSKINTIVRKISRL